MTDDILDLLSNFELPPSEELKSLDRALEESKKIQILLEASSSQIEKLSTKHEAASNNYFYQIIPSSRLSFSCMKHEYEIFSLYNTHLSYLIRQKLEQCSPKRHRRISYVSMSSSLSSPSASSNEALNEDDDQKCLTGDPSKPIRGCRTRKDFLRTYNKTKTEKIKCKREMDAALFSLDKALSLSAERAREAKNYNWLRERVRMPPRKRGDELNLSGRRSISTTICRANHSATSTPIKVNRPMSSSVIF